MICRGNKKATLLMFSQAMGWILLCTLSVPALGAGAVPLAIVNGDTISSADLEKEIVIMKKMKGEAFQGDLVLPSPEEVLRRLTQNLLIVQEGYRLGLDRKFSVTNQVRETVRLKLVASLLDSIATRVPSDTPDLLSRRKVAVEDYVSGLMQKYDVQVDSTLLASLDFGSGDPEVKRHLRESEDVLAILPTGALRVRSLSMVIRFTEFHGLTGRPDAAAARDQIFKEWLVEGLLSHEAKVHGLDQRPDIRQMALDLEKNRVSEEMLKSLLNFVFDPTEEEVEEFYSQNLDAVTPSPKVRMQSVMLSGQEAAVTFRERLQKGAKLSWLKKKKVTPEVVEGPAPFPEDWYPPEKLGLRPEDVFKGSVPEPYEVPGGAWAVAMVSEIEEPSPLPLDECRGTILQRMRKQATQDAMQRNFQKLEEVADVRILPGAHDVISALLAAAVASN